MASGARTASNKKNTALKPEKPVSAQNAGNIEAIRLSRARSASTYAKIRKKRIWKRSIIISASFVLMLLVAVGISIVVYANSINDSFRTNLQGVKIDFEREIWQEVLVMPQTEEEPFWMLLLGSDGYSWDRDIARTDVIILVHVDQPNKRAAMISIPRDTYVYISGLWSDKINAAYTWGEIYGSEGGVPVVIKTVSEFAGVDIAYFAMVNFDGFAELVDALGGVEVDVPVSIIGDREAGDVDIYPGVQTLNGQAALTFVRSRYFGIGDYQRTANQRTFLQALAKKVLSDPSRITTSATQIANMTFTNMDLQRILKVAYAMNGMQESDIYTYYVPSYTDTVYYDETPISVVRASEREWKQLIAAINSGNYPPPQKGGFAGETPESYQPKDKPTGEKPNDTPITIKTNDYVVDVLNGSGIEGSAKSISDRLKACGYKPGVIGNVDNGLSDATLIIFKDVANWAAAEDIRQRLGYGWVISSEGRYEFDGDVLVIVGEDYGG